MTERGFNFTQPTIWTIEHSQCAVETSEAVALAEALGVRYWRELTSEPRGVRLGTRIDRANYRASVAYVALKDAAEAYMRCQIELAFRVREATDAG